MSRPVRRRGKAERHRLILEELRVEPAIRVRNIAQKLGVHVETIRRDLDELHAEGKINRTYGGAMLGSTGVELSIDERDRLLIAERTRIAEEAARLVNPGDVVMVDVGSTTAHFGRSLAARGCEVRIITNSWRLATVVASAPQIEILLCPGQYSHQQGGVAGVDTLEYLKRFHADKAVLSIGGLTEDGIYEFDPDFAWVKRTMLANADRRILMVDHSKFGRKIMTKVCGFDRIDHLVVDQRPDARILGQIEKSGVQLHIATGGADE